MPFEVPNALVDQEIDALMREDDWSTHGRDGPRAAAAGRDVHRAGQKARRSETADQRSDYVTGIEGQPGTGPMKSLRILQAVLRETG